MIKIVYKYLIILLLIFFLKPLNSFGQYFLYTKEPPNLDIKFLRHSVEIEASKSFFNVVTITNRGSQQETFTLFITVPNNWNVIGAVQQEITLNPLDSIIVPIRVAVQGKVRGDIGYSVIASVSDGRGNTIKNEYCFVKVKRKEDLSISVPVASKYFDQGTGLADFLVKINNNGNREELVNLTFELSEGIGYGANMLENYSTDITVPPFTDTTLTFSIKLKENQIEGKESYQLKFKGSTRSQTYSKTIWFRSLKSEYKNFISSNEKVLKIDLKSQGLLNEGKKPQLLGIISGKTLLNHNRDIYYYYRNLSSQKDEDFYKYNHMYLGANLGRWQIEIGDSYRLLESSLSGRGLYLNYSGKPFYGFALANKDPRNNRINAATLIGLNYFKNYTVEIGVNYNKLPNENIESKIGLINTKFKIGRNHNISTLFAINSLNREIDNKKSHTAYSWELQYRGKVGDLNNSFKLRYGSPYYFGRYSGRLYGTLNTSYKISENNKLQLTSNINNITSPYILENHKLYNKINNINNFDLLDFWDINSKTTIFFGPGFSVSSRNIISNNVPYDKNFTTNLYSIQIGSKFRFDEPGNSLTPKITIGKNKVMEYPLIFGDSPSLYRNNKQIQYYTFDVVYNSAKWSFIASYESGPKNIFSQYNYFYIGRTTKNLRLMPTYNSFLYKNIIYLEASVVYNNNMILKNSFINFSALFSFFLKHDWIARINAFYNINNRTVAEGTVENYQNLYLEASISKEFNLPHPRVSYLDLNIIVFKDFNGNRIQESNEPGIKNTIVSLTRNRSKSDEKIPGDIGNIDLLTDYLGRVFYENIPSGLYTIEYNPVGNDAGTFSKISGDLNIDLKKDQTIYIPFVEKNKVFGKIVLNRSRLSGLGKVDVSNIRITATDSRGNLFSTLTNKEGEFIIYAPVTDEYIVNINNIFYEDFDLRQNNFRVQFNGYKQFEVNFVFDEKIRRINFSPSNQDNLAEGVMQIRRTNLRGTVKDATSLKPIRARINLVNTKNNSVVTSIYSNPQTGDYALSFLAEDIYLLEILADDYWYFSENLNLNQVTTFMNVTKDILLKQISIGSKIELNIRFEINKSDLGPETVAELNRLLRILKDNSNIKIEIQGHCDDLEAINNPQIGEERAKAVAKYLIENGFSNIQVRGFGNTSPIAPSDSEENRSLNRRVEIEVISK